MTHQDLTLKFLPRVDNHLARRLLQNLEGSQYYPAAAVSKLKEKIDFPRPAASLEELETKCKVLLDIVRDEASIDELIKLGNFNSGYLGANFDVGPEHIEAFFQYARVLYEQEAYSDTNLILFYYRALSPEPQKLISCYWGKINAQLLSQGTVEAADQCLADIYMLQKLINERKDKSSLLEVLEMRVWLLHSSLFLFCRKHFEVEAAEDSSSKVPSSHDMSMKLLSALINFFIDDLNLQAIQSCCQWLLRYLVVAAILTKAKVTGMRPILRALKQEEYQYVDCFTTFLTSLLQEADFTTAMRSLKECEKIIEEDFFLKPFKKQFRQNALSKFFETYSKVYSSIDIAWLAKESGIDEDKAERWVVNVIKSSNLNARIDSEQGKVYMKHKLPNPYKQTIVLTKDLAFRTYRLVSELS